MDSLTVDLAGVRSDSAMEEVAEEKLIRDLTRSPIDVPLLDVNLSAFYGTNASMEKRSAADHILREMQNKPDIVLQVILILSNTQNLDTKLFALQVLEGVIKYRWNALPGEQQDEIRKYLSEVIVELSCDEVSLQRERLYVDKLIYILVQILKHEEPARRQGFITALVHTANMCETICESVMAIFKLLCEEVFSFSMGEMTQQKAQELTQFWNSELQLIHHFCLRLLLTSQRTELIRATLATVDAFLSWIPQKYIFESSLMETLLKFLSVPSYRNLTLRCLTKIAALKFGDFYNLQYANMYNVFILQLQDVLPTSVNIVETYANGFSEEQAFIQNLALFFTSFYKFHICVLESKQENIATLLMGLDYLINISYVDDTEVFKVCLDYWNSLVFELFEAHHNLESPAATANRMGLQMPLIPGVVDGLGSQLMQRRKLYASPMSKLRLLMISRMAKPEVVPIAGCKNRNIVRETMKNNDDHIPYKIMRETLINLTHLDYDDTEKQMLNLLSKQLNGKDWTINNLNKLCWAIGSISGSMIWDQEERFLTLVLRGLLDLCETSEGKHKKAVIVRNIRYIVGLYPRFVRAHIKFLRTVMDKLIELMHETHPRVKDEMLVRYVNMMKTTVLARFLK